MKVSELIEKLKKYPQDMKVLIYDHDSTCSYVPLISEGTTYTDRIDWNSVDEKHVELSLGISPSSYQKLRGG